MPTGILPPGDHNIPLQMQTPNVKAEGVPSDDPSLEEEADDDGSTRRIKIPNDLDIIHRMATFVVRLYVCVSISNRVTHDSHVSRHNMVRPLKTR